MQLEASRPRRQSPSAISKGPSQLLLLLLLLILTPSSLLMQDSDKLKRVSTLYEWEIKNKCRYNYDDLWDAEFFQTCVAAFEEKLREESLTETWEAAKGPATWDMFAEQLKAGLPLWTRPGWKHALVGQPFGLDSLDHAVLLGEGGQDSAEPPAQRSRVVLLMLFMVGCDFCEPIYPVLREIRASSPANRLSVAAVNYASLKSTPEDVLRAYVKERKQKGNMPFPVYWDKNRSVTLATAKRTEIPFTPNCFLFVDEKLVWHGDPDPELEEHSGFRQAVRDALQKIDETI